MHICLYAQKTTKLLSKHITQSMTISGFEECLLKCTSLPSNLKLPRWACFYIGNILNEQ